MTVKSISFDQHEILKSIVALHLNTATFDVDMCYGNGQFYTNGTPRPLIRFDIDNLDDCIQCDSTRTPLPNAGVRSVIFDPPFLTYIKRRDDTNSIMGKRFSGYWSYDELEDHYVASIKEAARILAGKGIFVIKCQDIIHNHRIHPTHINVVRWCEENGFRLKDLFVLCSKHRMNYQKTQKHARIYHSYFLVFERRRGRK